MLEFLPLHQADSPAWQTFGRFVKVFYRLHAPRQAAETAAAALGSKRKYNRGWTLGGEGS